MFVGQHEAAPRERECNEDELKLANATRVWLYHGWCPVTA